MERKITLQKSTSLTWGSTCKSGLTLFDKDVHTVPTVLVSNASHESAYVYDLVAGGVVNNYGGMMGGHYVANCKVTACSPEGSEEVEHNFNGAGVHAFGTKEKEVMQTSSWKLGKSKEKENGSINTTRLASSASTGAESSEPLRLQLNLFLLEM